MRILFLGGAIQQIPVIEYAIKHGHYTILCDFLPDNPGKLVAERFYLVSTTDKEKILEIAIENKIEAVLAYASDPAALTAAYIGCQMNIPSNSYETVEILSKKDLFRNFLRANQFETPLSESFNDVETASDELSRFKFPLMVKPIDSSGSKGVSIIYEKNELEDKFHYAMNFSRDKKVILEEYIEMDHPCMVGGDAFVINGNIVFIGCVNSHRNHRISKFVPIGTSYPLLISEERIVRVKLELQKLITAVKFKSGAVNIEFMFDKEDRIFIIEVGPRNGGNMIPEMLNEMCGFDMVRASVECAMGNQNIDVSFHEPKGYYLNYVLHSEVEGIFLGIEIDTSIQGYVIRQAIFKEIGSKIEVFDGSNKAIGIIAFRFDDEILYKKIVDIPEDYIKVKSRCE